MRITGLILSLILIASISLATDKTAVNEENVKMFIEMYPKFKEMTERSGGYESTDNETPQMSVAKMYEYQEEFNSLFSKYGISIEEFAQLMQKVSIAYACAQMKAQGQDTYGMSVPEEDLNVIKKYQAELEKALEVKD